MALSMLNTKDWKVQLFSAAVRLVRKIFVRMIYMLGIPCIFLRARAISRIGHVMENLVGIFRINKLIRLLLRFRCLVVLTP